MEYTSATWQVWDTGAWKKYPPEVAARLEQAYIRGERTCPLPSIKPREQRIVDLCAMEHLEQTMTGITSVKVRRTTSGSSGRSSSVPLRGMTDSAGGGACTPSTPTRKAPLLDHLDVFRSSATKNPFAADVAGLGGSLPRWMVFDDLFRKWLDYDPEMSKLLEDKYSAYVSGWGLELCKVPHLVADITVNFKSMEEVNSLYGRRKVQRAAGAASSAAGISDGATAPAAAPRTPLVAAPGVKSSAPLKCLGLPTFGFNMTTGVVDSLLDSSARIAGVKIGWRVTHIDGQPYKPEIMRMKIAGNFPYTVAFEANGTDAADEWTEVPHSGGTYWWNKATGEVTRVGDPCPAGSKATALPAGAARFDAAVKPDFAGSSPGAAAAAAADERKSWSTFAGEARPTSATGGAAGCGAGGLAAAGGAGGVAATRVKSRERPGSAGHGAAAWAKSGERPGLGDAAGIYHVWQWSSSPISWQNYEPQISNKLEMAYLNGDPTCQIEARGQRYVVDVKFMLQIQVSDHTKTRNVRRIFAGEAPSVDRHGGPLGMDAGEYAALLRQIVHPLLAYAAEPRFEGLLSRAGGAAFDDQDICSLSEDYYRALCNGEPLEGARGKPEQVMAALSLAWFNGNLERPLENLRFSSGDPFALQKAWHEWTQLARSTSRLPDVREKAAGFSWLRKDNSAAARFERLACSCTTLRYAHREKASRAASLVFYSDLKSDRAAAGPLSITQSDADVFDTAASLDPQMRRIVVVNAASAYHVGGGFSTGGRHALEEAMCTRSTLFLSLKAAEHEARHRGVHDQTGRPIHVPTDGAILSPDVRVFRSSTDSGYKFLGRGEFQLAAVVSIAMPNGNYEVSDSPVEPVSGPEYEELIAKKMQAMVHAATQARAQVLVMPDVGCGAFHNDPVLVGKTLGQVLRSNSGSLSEVVLTGCSRQFVEATMLFYSGSARGLPRAASPARAGTRAASPAGHRRAAEEIAVGRDGDAGTKLDSAKEDLASARPKKVSSRMPGLPDLQLDVRSWATGPHSTCNFILPGKLIAGSFPGDRKEPEHSQKVAAVLGAGVNTFVCLQEADELRRFTPYMETARRVAAFLLTDPAALEFWHCPIPDNSVTTDAELAKGVAAVADALFRGRVVYVHCWGGHGRTGTLICAFLVQVYGLTTEQAQAHFMAGEQTRRERRGHWPHGREQHSQVMRFAAMPLVKSPELLAPLKDWA